MTNRILLCEGGGKPPSPDSSAIAAAPQPMVSIRRAQLQECVDALNRAASTLKASQRHSVSKTHNHHIHCHRRHRIIIFIAIVIIIIINIINTIFIIILIILIIIIIMAIIVVVIISIIVVVATTIVSSSPRLAAGASDAFTKEAVVLVEAKSELETVLRLF